MTYSEAQQKLLEADSDIDRYFYGRICDAFLLASQKKC